MQEETVDRALRMPKGKWFGQFKRISMNMNIPAHPPLVFV
jgi:hypothetical protein